MMTLVSSMLLSLSLLLLLSSHLLLSLSTGGVGCAGTRRQCEPGSRLAGVALVLVRSVWIPSHSVRWWVLIPRVLQLRLLESNSEEHHFVVGSLVLGIVRLLTTILVAVYITVSRAARQRARRRE